MDLILLIGYGRGRMDRALGKYLPLDSARRQVISFWAPIVVMANRLTSEVPNTEAQRKAVIDRACWAVTEITRGAATKLFRQRYWSLESLRWITDNGRAGATSALRHEHVLTRAEMVAQLRTCTELDAVTVRLESAIACVVTKGEAESLNKTRAGAWARYHRMGVCVFDRQERTLLVFTDVASPVSENQPIGSYATPGASRSDIARQTLATMRELEQLCGEPHFPELHHFIKKGRRVSFRQHWGYCERTEVRDGANGDTMRRVAVAVEAYRTTGSWDVAIGHAWQRIP